MSPIRRITPVAVAVIAAAAVFSVAFILVQGQRGSQPEPVAAADPNPVPGLVAMAEGHLARAAGTGDPTWLVRAERAARRAVRLDPRAFEAMDTLATIAATRHRFPEALAWTRRSLAVAPTRVAPVGIRADALIELGRYREGFAAVQRRLDLRPDLPAYSRASYVRELVGDRPGAVRLMRMAVEASAPASPERATARAQLGLVLLHQGDLDGAEREIRTALAEVPGDANASFVLAQVLVARGDLGDALPLLRQVAEELPEPDHLALLAEVERALGQREAARADVARMRAAFDRLEATGSDADLDRALLEADLRRPTPADVDVARRGRAARPGVVGDQVLGWVLTRAGRCTEGDRHATRSLRLGTRDPLMLFHAGMAAACAGRPAVARARLAAALDLNPAFSLRWAPVATRELERLRS